MAWRRNPKTVPGRPQHEPYLDGFGEILEINDPPDTLAPLVASIGDIITGR